MKIHQIIYENVAEKGYGTHPSQRVDPRTGKKYVPPKSPLGKGVAEATGDKPFDQMMRMIKQGTKKQARADRRERDAASRERARAAFGPSPADKLSIGSDKGVSESGYNPLDDERREQRRIDQERAQFRRDELEAELGDEEQRAQQIMSGTWYVIIDGRVWKRQGEPVAFQGKNAARRAGQTIKNRTPERTVAITQTLPTTESSDISETENLEIASNPRTVRILSQIRARNPHANNDLEALIYDYQRSQRQDRDDIGRLDQEIDNEEAEIDQVQAELDRLRDVIQRLKSRT